MHMHLMRESHYYIRLKTHANLLVFVRDTPDDSHLTSYMVTFTHCLFTVTLQVILTDFQDVLPPNSLPSLC